MPIYAYRCEHCGYQQDILQKMSDPLLVTCPSCGEAAFRKQVTAAGFQLKGSGWYVTDFRNPAVTKDADKKTDGPSSDAAPGTSSSEGKGSDSAPAPSATPAAAPTATDNKAAPTPAPAPPAAGTS